MTTFSNANDNFIGRMLFDSANDLNDTVEHQHSIHSRMVLNVQGISCPSSPVLLHYLNSLFVVADSIM